MMTVTVRPPRAAALLAAFLALTAGGAVKAATLSVIGVDLSMVGAIDRETIKTEGGQATADMVVINGDPDNIRDVGPVTTVHMRFDCAGKRVSSPGGVTQDSTGSAPRPIPGHDWEPVDPQTPAMAAFDLVCLDKEARPEWVFSTILQLTAFYGDYRQKAAAGPKPAAPARTPPILTDDVTRFYRVYESAGGHPTAEQLDRDYLAPGSAQLHDFAKARNVSGATIAAAIANHPETYVGSRRCLAVLPRVKQRLARALDRLAALYPEARLAPITLLVGRGRPVGITSPSGVEIGLEALCAADFMDPNVEDRFVHVIAHEYGHVEQRPELGDLNPGDPRATVLYMSLMEGVGEFTAELISGDVANYRHKAATKGHELEIETAFVADQDKTDLSHWLYNGAGTAEHPGDLGYWVGYRIVKAYYAHAADKHQALRDIYEMSDPKAFLADSGWRPGM